MLAFLSLKHLLGLYLALKSVPGVASLNGDSWCGKSMCIDATVHGDTVNYSLTALEELGWMAIGWGRRMALSPMVIVWRNNDSSVTLTQRRVVRGILEPQVDVNPPRIAALSSRDDLWDIYPSSSIAFDVPKNNDTTERLIWAYSMTRPDKDPDSHLEKHVAFGHIKLDLSKELVPNTDSRPTASSSTPVPGQAAETASPASSPESESTSAPTVLNTETTFLEAISELARYEKLIIVHGILVTIGFLVLLPMGALVARWGRTMTTHWLKAHWVLNTILGFPLIAIGWVLGPLAVSDQGAMHLRDVHMVFGVLLFMLYLCQLCIGRFIQLQRSVRPAERLPSRKVLHTVLGIGIIGGAFFQTRSGLHEWSVATGGSLPSALFTVWTAWVVIIPIAYLSGLVFLRRQIIQERLGMTFVPTTYVPFSDTSSSSLPSRGSSLEDDGTHDLYSPPTQLSAESSAPGEMREVHLDGVSSVGLPSQVR